MDNESKVLTINLDETQKVIGKFKTLEVDVDKKIFKVNGIDFSHCQKAVFYLECKKYFMDITGRAYLLKSED